MAENPGHPLVFPPQVDNSLPSDKFAGSITCSRFAFRTGSFISSMSDAHPHQSPIWIKAYGLLRPLPLAHRPTKTFGHHALSKKWAASAKAQDRYLLPLLALPAPLRLPLDNRSALTQRQYEL